MKEFNIHGLVRIRIESPDRYKLDTAMHHWREFLVPVSDQPVDIIIRDYSNSIPANGAWFADGVAVTDGRIDFGRYGFAIKMGSGDTPIELYSHRLPVPLNFLVQLVISRKGYSLVHGAAIQYKGKNILFPAFGGVGKTILMSSIVSDGGKIFGDDMIMVGKKGMLPYPLDLSIYEYHLPILGISDPNLKAAFKRDVLCEKVLKFMQISNTRPSRALQYLVRGLKRNCFSLPVQDVFGSASLAAEGPIHSACFLIRKNCVASEIILEDVDPSAMADMCVSVLTHEWAPGTHSWVCPANMLGDSSTKFGIGSAKDILLEAFAGISCRRAIIPVSMSPEVYSRDMMRLLNSHAI